MKHLFFGLILITSLPAFAELKQKGIALGLFAEDPGFSYEPLLAEIKATGADHVSIIIPYYQHSIRSIKIGPHPRFSPKDAVIKQTIKQAQKLGLKIFLFPILRLQYAVTPQEWRGSIRPRDLTAWWQSYSQFILKFAKLAKQYNAKALCIGSELGTMDLEPKPWEPLIKKIRQIFKGQLVYSANWDHYDQVRIWHLVDLAGLSAYFQLTDGKEPVSLPRLTHAWREQRVQISRWRVQINKPLIFTEIGYHSQQGTSAWPWDESAAKPISQKEQKNCYQAFTRVFNNTPYLAGVYFWNWFGWGGQQSREYCPRGKSAAQIICSWYGNKTCPRTYGVAASADQGIVPEKREAFR